MKKLAILLIVVTIALAGCSEKKNNGGTGAKINWESYQEGMNESNSTGKPVILYFYSSINKLNESIFSNPDITNKSKNFVMIKINNNSRENESILKKYNIENLPSIIFLNSNGTEIYRMVDFNYSEEKILQNFSGEMEKILGSYTNSIIWLDYEEGMNEINKTGKPAILYFYYSNYQLCKYTDDYIFSNNAVISKSKNFVMIKINVGNNKNRNILLKYRFQYISYLYKNNYYPYLPTVIFMDKNKRVLHRLITIDVYNPDNQAQSIKDFLSSMDKALKGKIWGYDFSFATLNGQTKHLHDYRGKVAIVNLMDVNCPACRRQMQDLEDIINHYRGDKVVVISIDINSQESVDSIRSTYGKYTQKWTFGVDKYGDIYTLANKYWIMYTPTNLIFDKYGRIQYLGPGAIPSQQLISIIDEIK